MYCFLYNSKFPYTCIAFCMIIQSFQRHTKLQFLLVEIVNKD